MKAANDNARLLTRSEAAAYCGSSLSTFSAWVAAGHMPKPLFGSRKWDKNAIDAALDKASGLVRDRVAKPEAEDEDPVAAWLRGIKCA